MIADRARLINVPQALYTWHTKTNTYAPSSRLVILQKEMKFNQILKSMQGKIPDQD